MASSITTCDVSSGTSHYHSLSSDSWVNVDYIANNIVPLSLRFMFESDDETDSEFFVSDSSCEKLNIDPFVIGHIVDHPDLHGELILRLQVNGLTREECDPTIVVIRVSGISADKQRTRDQVIDNLQKYSKDLNLTLLLQPVVHKEVIGLIETKAACYIRRNAFNGTSVFQHADQGQIIAIGPKEEVDKLAEELLRDIVTQRKDIREKFFNADQLLLLRLRQFDKKMMKKNPEFVIEIQTDKVRAEGLQEDVNSIFLELERELMKFEICKMKLSEIQLKLLGNGSVANNLLQQLSDQHRLKKIRLQVDSNSLAIVSERLNIVKVKTALIQCLMQYILIVPDIAISLEEFLKQLQCTVNALFEAEIDESKSQITFACLEKDFKNVQHRVQQLIEQQLMRKEIIELPEAQLLFLNLKFTEDADSSAKVTFLSSDTGIMIHGTSNDIETCRNKIMATTENMKRIRLGIQAEKLVLDFISSADGKKVLEEVTGKHGVCIIGPNHRSSLKIEMGRIEDYKADVLLNSVSPNLDLKVGKNKIASSFLRKGGKELQSLLKTNYPGGVAYDEMVVTTATGDIQCKHIFHCCLQTFVSDIVSMPKLKRMLEKCLQNAENLEHESIAMPVFGTGINRFPSKLVAETMMDVIGDFFHKNPFAKLQSVTVVLLPSEQQLKKFFDVEIVKRKRNISFIGQYFTRAGLYLSDMNIDVVSDVDDVTDFITSLDSAISDVLN